MTPKELEDAWTLQATYVAGTLALSEEQTAKLVDAYKAAREGYQSAFRGLIQAANMLFGEDSGHWEPCKVVHKSQAEAAETEIAELEKALSGIDKEKLRTAVVQLGTFSREWDRMVRVIAGFNLGDKQDKALELISTYNVDYTAAVNETMAARDFRAVSGVQKEHKARLDDGLKAILSKKQMTSWTKATPRRGYLGLKAILMWPQYYP